LRNSFTNILRALYVVRVLARYDALFLVDEMDQVPLPLKIVRRIVPLFAFGRQVDKSLRRGERLARALQALGPSFIKLGQALSVRADLMGEEIAQDLGNLRDKLPPFSFEEAKNTVERELGRPLDEIYTSFDETPIAAASIAQVHFAEIEEMATVVDEKGEERQEPFRRKVAVKILRPDIEKAFERDLQLFFWIADLVERFQPDFRRLRPRKIVEILEQSVSLEMDLRMEAAAASELAENFADDDEFSVPAIDWERTAQRVMTQGRVEGISLSNREALKEADIDLEKLSAVVIRVFLHQVLRDGFFHADMHHGNLFVTPEGKLIAVDFGIMGRMDMDTRLFMAEMLYAFLTGDYRRAAEVHFEAGYVPKGKSLDAFTQACRSIGEPILGKPVNEISIGRLLIQLFQITETFEMETQPQLLLLQKTMVTAEGVAHSLNNNVNFWEVSYPTVEEWIRENMGPEARIAQVVNDGMSFARKLPTLVSRADRLLSRMEEEAHEADLKKLKRSSFDHRGIGPVYFICGLAAGISATVLYLLS